MLKLVRSVPLLCLLFDLAATAQPNSQRFISNLSVPIGNSYVTVVNDMAGGDIDGDGKPDLVMSQVGQDNTANPPYLVWFKGNGDGTFTQRPIANALNNVPQTVLLADLNGDGILDLVTTANGNPGIGGASGAAELDIYIGNGDGTFKTPQRFLQNVPVITPVLADLKGNSLPDVVVVANGSVEVLENLGGGKFILGQTLAPPSGDSFVSVLGAADFNNDGEIDVLASDSQGLRVLTGHGNNRLSVGSVISLPGSLSRTSHPVQIADVNGDGFPDVFASLSNESEVFLSNGDGTFTATPPLTYPVPGSGINSPYSVVKGDFNHDGHADFVVGPYAYFGNGDGSFRQAQVYSVTGSPEIGLDVNSDGNRDLVWADVTAYFGSSLNVAIGSASGVFRAPQETPVSNNGQAQPIVKGDFNSDGITDVATLCGYSSVCVLKGTGQGTLLPPDMYSTPSVSGLAAGDVDGDGILDLIVTSQVNNSTFEVTMLKGNGDGTFATPVTSPFSATQMGSDAILIDVNHDGKLDLIGAWGVALGNGDGTFQAATPLPGNPSGIKNMVAADFNRDGNVDLALYALSSSGGYQIEVLLGNKKGAFSTPIPYSDPNLFDGLAVADVNGDGIPDILYTSLTPAFVTGLSVAFGNGNGTFAPATAYSFPSFYCCENGSTVVAADFDGDGIPDAIATTFDHIEYFKGLPGGTFAAAQEYTLGQNTQTPSESPHEYVVLDLNKDGYPDLAVTDEFFGITRLLNSGIAP